MISSFDFLILKKTGDSSLRSEDGLDFWNTLPNPLDNKEKVYIIISPF